MLGSWKPPADEWHSIALGYTSGTTSSPKGVVLSHRGAYIMALTYLWTLPMLHCNGWCFTWTLAGLCGTIISFHQVWGESPCAFVTLKGNEEEVQEEAGLVDIMKFCRERMPAYWVQKSVVFGPLPKTAKGKIKKHLLMARAEEMGTLRKSRL
ncbi:Acetate/butyrate--CoA ligase AAE7, peroxisomal [Acorus gramineus]|uniref:4-coumarate--CoA ligase n=1 Tax=Acorus gramineus TaxID=55184 RepID=A0AAV9B988_ACOGR|nr:Acetate/butyrate--CoA ligase AAE7, peroxisomal [Acorus gramineus]